MKFTPKLKKEGKNLKGNRKQLKCQNKTEVRRPRYIKIRTKRKSECQKNVHSSQLCLVWRECLDGSKFLQIWIRRIWQHFWREKRIFVKNYYHFYYFFKMKSGRHISLSLKKWHSHLISSSYILELQNYITELRASNKIEGEMQLEHLCKCILEGIQQH